MNLKTCRKVETETERLNDMLVIIKKRTKESIFGSRTPQGIEGVTYGQEARDH